MSYYNIFLLVLGFIFLLTGADFMVKGASSLAYKIKIPRIFIGLIIIALGTSVPELAISIKSALLEKSGLVIGNILGSNITNIFLFFGLGGLLFPFKTTPTPYKKKNGIFLVIVSILVCILLSTEAIGMYKGVFLLCIFVLFIIISYIFGKKYSVTYATQDEADKNKNRHIMAMFILLLGGILGTVVGSEFIIDGTINLAKEFNIHDTVLGSSVVSLGTSLPEIIVSVVALYKQEKALALGNIIGSNIINILVAVGVSAIITPIQVSENLLIYYIVLILSSLFILFVSLKQTNINRLIGLICLTIYVVFTLYNFGK